MIKIDVLLPKLSKKMGRVPLILDHTVYVAVNLRNQWLREIPSNFA